jgi:hypothetical protein
MRTILNILFFLCTLACHDKNDSDLICDVANPAKDLAWLKAEIETREKSTSDLNVYFYIQQGEYQGQTVFIYNNCCPMCNTIISVYDCSGAKLFDMSNDIKIDNVKTLWKPNGNPCQSL